jgi:hypothetical protein
MEKLAAQCSHPITHLNGIAIVNNTSVTVTPQGSASSLSWYCPEYTQPYSIGTEGPSGFMEDGGYRFEFSPPVDAVTINLSGITNYENGTEIISLYRNNEHYALSTSQQVISGCGTTAVITPEGNITACYPCNLSSIVNVTIPGPIYSLLVYNVVTQSSGAALLGVYMCNPTLDVHQNENTIRNLKIYETNKDLHIESKITFKEIEIHNLQGQMLLQRRFSSANSSSINVEQFSRGIYLIHIKSDEFEVTKKIVIK